ncbi:MAG: hypothetical protein ABIF87_07155 [Pseudomonadota bacterium]
MEEKQVKIQNARGQKPRIHKNFAYKTIFVGDGLIFLFEEIKPFTAQDVKINPYNGDLFIELGNNVALITEKILKHFIKTRHLFLYKSPFSAYEAEEQVLAFEAESEVLARIQGAWEITKRMGEKETYSS